MTENIRSRLVSRWNERSWSGSVPEWWHEEAGTIAAEINAMVDRCHATEAAMATQTRQVSELRATIDRLQRELAEARAYISTIIDAPGEGG